MDEAPVLLSAGSQRILVDPRSGGRATSWRVHGTEVLHAHGPHAVEHGMYAMAPWAGRLRGNAVATENGDAALPATYGPWALHGTALDRPARVETIVDEGDRAEVVLVSETHPEWPWPMQVRIHWILEPDHLTTRIEVHALAEPFPVTVGWHPWFRRRLEPVGSGVEARVVLDAAAMLERDDAGLPAAVVDVMPAGPFDDAFLVPSGCARIEWPREIAIDIESDGRWIVLFDERDECICLEPQSGPPDGLVGHPWHEPVLARPGAPVSQTVTWRVRDLREARG